MLRRRAVAIVALVSSLVLAALVVPHCALARAHRSTGFGGREAGVGLGLGHGIPATHAQGAVHLSIPAPSAIRERQPASRATRDPFPDFNVPLRRHRMAMPDSAIPALGDLSF